MPISGYPLLGLCHTVLLSTPALAEMDIVTQTFDIPPAYCEGLGVAGVTYSFTVAGTPNLDCVAGTFAGPGISNNLHYPNIEGTAAGVLHLTFDVPTTKFGFGVAQNTLASPRSVIVDLYRPGVGLLREEIPLATTNDPRFVGARSDYDGPAVKTVTIRLAAGPYSRIAVDNVTYFRPPGLTK
jgi:hypothetical protein